MKNQQINIPIHLVKLEPIKSSKVIHRKPVLHKKRLYFSLNNKPMPKPISKILKIW